MKKLLLFALSLAVSLAAAEAGARAYEQARTARIQTEGELYEYDGELGWRLRAGAATEQSREDFHVSYHIGADGFRLGPRPCRPHQEPTVWVFGDSYVFGLGVNDDETFAAVLSRLIDACVVNVGVTGYDPGQYQLLRKRLGGRIGPRDWIVWGIFTGNDIDFLTEAFPVGYNKPKPYWSLTQGHAVLRGVPVLHSDTSRETKEEPSFLNSRLLARARNGVGTSYTLRRMTAALGLFPKVDLERLDTQLRIFTDLTRDLPQARWIPVLIPSISLVERRIAGTREDITYRRLRRLLDGRAIDLLTPFEGRRGLHHPNEGHWTAEAHQKAAQAIARRLELPLLRAE